MTNRTLESLSLVFIECRCQNAAGNRTSTNAHSTALQWSRIDSAKRIIRTSGHSTAGRSISSVASIRNSSSIESARCRHGTQHRRRGQNRSHTKIPRTTMKNCRRTGDNTHGLLQRTKRPEKSGKFVPNLKLFARSNCMQNGSV